MKTNYSVIVVDDDDDDQFLLIKAIEQMAITCKVRQAYNGAQLLDMLFKRNQYADVQDPLPDLIILDLNMPIMDGYEALSQIKKTDRLKNIPVYILTTSEFEYDKIKAIAYGANKFYTKPSAHPDLIEIVKAILTDAADDKQSLKKAVSKLSNDLPLYK